jgi:flagellar L-ring protein precursor FlgH
MNETLELVAIKEDAERNPTPGARAKRATVRDWLGVDFLDRALQKLEEQKRQLRTKELLALLGVAMLLWLAAGCATAKPTALSPINAYRAVDYATGAIPGKVKPSHGLGSLWPGEQYRNLIADHRAALINDVVTVKIVEDSSAKGTAATKNGKTSSIGLGISGLFGLEQSLAKMRPNMNVDSMVSAKSQNSFDGTGETSRTTKVVATISCIVADAHPNGNLLIRGKRVIKVNGEDQVITLSGIIRPEDIGGDNTIESTRIADANITYWGVGVLADKQRQGWMTRALDYAWPF